MQGQNFVLNAEKKFYIETNYTFFISSFVPDHKLPYTKEH
jgi:hypothetical protein